MHTNIYIYIYTLTNYIYIYIYILILGYFCLHLLTIDNNISIWGIQFHSITLIFFSSHWYIKLPLTTKLHLHHLFHHR